MSVDYLSHLVMRQVYFWTGLAVIIYYRNEYGENNPYAALTISLLLTLLFESVLYANRRAQAKLFMRIKTIAI